jgi:glycosyltransferase involved in cell wall biosynthesis
VVQEADRIIANTPLCCTGLQAAYPGQRHKIAYLTNGFDPEFFPPPAPLVPVNPWLTVLHAGEIYSGRNPGPFFDALKALELARPASQSPVRVRLLGRFTEDCFDPRPAFQQRGLQHLVEVGGQVPYAEALRAMTQADILLLLDTPGRKVSIPAKLFEYLGAARPILALAEPDSDTAWALRASGNPHRIASPLDVAGIQRALVELRDGLQQGTLTLPSRERLTTFTRANLAQQLAGHLDRIVAKKYPASASAAGLSLSMAPHDAPQRLPAAAATSRPHYAGA